MLRPRSQEPGVRGQGQAEGSSPAPGPRAPTPSSRTQQLEDAELKVTGQVPIALDIDLPNLAYARCVRSPYAHARILSINSTAALALPGVVCVLTRDDLTHGRLFPYFGAAIKDQPIVAIDKARHVGDIVAAVVAEDPDTAAAAADLVEVEYEELPAVFDPVDALRPGAPLVHERIAGQYEILPNAGIRPQDGTNLINHMRIRRGDVAQGFAAADLVHEDVYSSPALQHVALEPHVAVAQWTLEPTGPEASSEGSAAQGLDLRGDGEGAASPLAAGPARLTVWSATQMPYFVRQQLADIFHLPVERVRIRVFTLGGAYGAKTYTRMEPLAAVLAWKAGRPVKVLLTRAEEFVTTTKHEARVRIKTGLKRDGTLLAREVEIHYNGGAYADRSGTIARSGGVGAIGPYRIPNVSVDAYAAYTNRPNAVPFRGLAVSQVAWAYECHTDELAHLLGMDPTEFRRKNLLEEGDAFCTGEEMHDVHFTALLEDAAAAVAWADPAPQPTVAGRAVGRGASVIIKHMGSNPATTTLEIRLDSDGTVSALSSTVEIGQGARTVLARAAARALDIPEERISVPYADTQVTPPDQGTSSSRSSFFNVLAAKAAAADLYRQLRELASEIYGAPDSNIRVRAGQVLLDARPPVEMDELLRLAGTPSITGSGSFRTEIGLDPETGQGKASHHWHQAAASAVVEVDLETGKVYLLRLHLATHAGQVIDRPNAELQNEGCAAFGLSQALFEEMVFDGGQVVNPNLSDYNVASLIDFPTGFTTTLREAEDPDAEVHGLGETGLPAVPPAIGNAVRDAIGVRIHEIPLMPERVLAVLSEQNS